MIRADRLSRSCAGRAVVSDVTLHVAAGECVTLAGARSGRRTLLRMLATLVPPTTGELQIAGFAVSSRLLDARRRLAFADPDCLVDGLRVDEYLLLVTRTRGAVAQPADGRASSLLAEATIQGSAAIGRLTTGQRRVLASAAALSIDADVLLLDEPFEGVDERTCVAMQDALEQARRQGKGIVIRTDASMTSRLTSRRVTLEEGRLR